MIYFCPTCSNLCALRRKNERMVICCRTCPFEERITKPETYTFYFPLKQPDNYVFEEAESWKNAAATEEKCPKCDHNRAYFMQIQIRSADEPMSTFYRCCNEQCKNTWRVD